MKSHHAACLLALLPTLGLAQVSDAPPKPAPVEPVLAKEHEGLGRAGVRLVIDKDSGLPMIASLTRGGPAEDSGLHVGDIIIKIGKNFTNTLSPGDVSLSMHGQPGSSFELTVQRDDDPHLHVFAIERRAIPAGAEDMLNPPRSEVANP